MIENDLILERLAKDVEVGRLEKMVAKKCYNPYDVDITRQIRK